tara:strand:+ start:2222 stop:2710 length:489 start_codon:yes stop_codon:yes gene_type:complete
MIRFFKFIPVIIFSAFLVFSFAKPLDTTNIKCMIQMTSYLGEGAYVVVSLINPDGEYEKTLYVQGSDPEWYSEISQWWKFHGKKRVDIDAISGATISGGERAVSILKIPNEKINMGYDIRFETAVEDQEYFTDDVQFELTSESIKSKVVGNGYIRYVRMIQQ